MNRIFAIIFLIIFAGILLACPDLRAQPQKVVDYVQVTTHPDIDLSPRISPDGRWMAYVSRQSANYDIWIRSTSGGRSHQVTFHRADDLYPAWYPDSRSLVFVSQRSDAAGDIWRIKLREVKGHLLRKGKAERLTFYLGFDGYPTVSPDGKKVAWVSDRTGRNEIWFHNDNTGRTTQLTFLGGTHPCWSPDLRFIAFTSFRAGPDSKGDIFVINLKGPKPVGADTTLWDPREPPVYQVTHGLANDGFPSWSPDAERLIFLRYAQDTNGDGVVSPRDRGTVWQARIYPWPNPSHIATDPMLRHLASSFRLSMMRYAMPLTSGAENAMQPWFGANGRIYFTSDRGGNLDIWSFPEEGHIPVLVDDSKQFALADETYPLPQRMTPEILGPLYLDWQPSSLNERERKLLFDRALAFRRVIDFHSPSASMAAAALYQMGVCYRLVGYQEQARLYFHILTQNYQDNPYFLAYTEMALLGMDAAKIPDEKRRVAFITRSLNDIVKKYPQQTKPAADALIAEGDLLYQSSDYAGAFSAYNRVLKEYENERAACAESQLKIGDVFKHYATEDEVVAAYLSVVKNYPEQRQWMIPARDRILDLMTAGIKKTNQLISRYREIVNRYREFPLLAAAAQLRIGRILVGEKDYNAALQEFELVETLFPSLQEEVFEARLATVHTLLAIGESLKAFNLLESWSQGYATTRPDMAQKAKDELISALIKSGDALKRNHDFALAAARYRRAKTIAPRNAEAHRGYIESLYYMKKIDQAIEEYEALMRQHPKNNIIIYSLGLAYSYKGTERLELYGDPNGLNAEALKNSSRLIALALSYDYTFVQAYLTISYNYEMMETYEARQRAKPIPWYRKIYNTVSAPVLWAYHALTFYEERKPQRYYERAIHELTKAIALNDETQNPGLEASLALNLANNYYRLGEFGYEKAYQYYHLKLRYDSTFVDKKREALIFTRMGHCALAVKDVEQGPHYLLRAIQLYKEFGDENMVLINTKRLALLYESDEQNDLAIDYYQRASDIEKRKGMYSDLMRSYRSIAYNFLLLNEPGDAIRYANRALKLIDEGKVSGAKEEVGRIKLGFFGLYFPVPFFSLSAMGTASAFGFTLDDERALIFTILGESFRNEKDYQNAIDYLEKKLTIFRKRKDYRAEAAFLNNLGYLHFLKADYQRAWDNFSRSLKICEKKKLPRGLLNNTLNCAQVVLFLQKTKTSIHRQTDTDNVGELLARFRPIAVEKVQQALDMLRHSVVRDVKFQARLLLARAELRANQLPEHNERDDLATSIESSLQAISRIDSAVADARLSLKLSKSRRYYPEQVSALYALGRYARVIRDVETAYKYFQECRRVALDYGLYDFLWHADLELGELISSMNAATRRALVVQKDDIEYYIEAIEVLEAHPSKGNGVLAASSRREYLTPYRRLVRSLYEKGDSRGGLQFAERMRAKYFLQLLQNEPLILRRERHKLYMGNARFLQDKINQLEIDLLRARYQRDVSASQIAGWQKTLKSYRREYHELLNKIRAEVPELESLFRVSTVDYQKVQGVLSPSQMILSYTVVGDRTLRYEITADTIVVKMLNVSRQEIMDEQLRETQLKTDSLSGSSHFAMNILPAQFPGAVRTLVIIPDQELFFLSWPLLLRSAGHTNIAPVITSSMTAFYFAFRNRRLQGEKIFLAGAKELEQPLRDMGYQVITPILHPDSDRLSSQNSAINLADIVHLTLQCQWNAVDPSLSRLAFRIGRSARVSFRIKDLFSQNLSAQLVVLDFDDAIAATFGPELFVALERAFIYAGASSILMPLMANQQDKAFYPSFYRNLLGMPAARALLQTRDDLMANNRPVEPQYAFEVFGFGGMSLDEAKQYAAMGFEGKVREGHSAFDLGEWADAIRFYEVAYEMARARNDRENMERLAQRLLESAVNGNLWDKAIEWQNELIQMAQGKNDMAGVATGYSNLAYFYTQKGDYEKGVEYKEKYARLAERYGLYEEEAKSLRETGLIYERGGNYDRAIAFFHQAERKFKSLNSVKGRAQCLRDVGRIYFVYLDDYPAALNIQLQALPLFKTLGVSPDYVDLLQNIGLTHEKMGNYQKALEYQNQALKLATQLHDDRLTGLCHQYIANVSWKMGNFRDALSHQEKATRLFSKIGDDKLLYIAYATRGLISLSLGQMSEAMSFELKALELARQHRNQADQATIYKNIGMIYRAQSQTNAALNSFLQATEIDSAISSQRGMAYDYRNLSAIYLDLGNASSALPLVRKALSVSEKIMDLRNRAQCLLVLGRAELALEQPDSARAHLRMAAKLSHQYYMPAIEWRAYNALARMEEQRGSHDQAIGAYYQAIDVIDRMRAQIKVEEYASGFIDDKQQVYASLVRLLFNQGEYARALDVVERAKSRSFLDMLGSRRIRFARVDSSLLVRGDSLRTLLNIGRTEYMNLLKSPDSLRQRQKKRLQSRIDSLESAYSDYLQQVRQDNAELSRIITVQPWPVDSIHHRLPANTAIIEYYYTNSELYTWLITPSALAAKRKAVSDSLLQQEVTSLRKALDRQLSIDESAQRLYRLLIEPWERDIKQASHIVFVPYGVLHYLPFSVLKNNEDEFFGLRYASSLSPSATVLGFCMSKGDSFLTSDKKSMAILALGNPDLGSPQFDLPYSALEIKSLRRYYKNVKSYLHQRATETRFRSFDGHPPMLLFSCHGVFDADNPLLSALLLAPDSLNDGRLEAHEIFSFNLPSYIVAMSACETGLATIRSGDEVIGLSRSFIYAGASSLMSSLWKVDDLATAVLVKRFFRYLSEGKSRTEALRLAQKVVHDEINPYPAYWGAFAITGDFR